MENNETPKIPTDERVGLTAQTILPEERTKLLQIPSDEQIIPTVLIAGQRIELDPVRVGDVKRELREQEPPVTNTSNVTAFPSISTHQAERTLYTPTVRTCRRVKGFVLGNRFKSAIALVIFLVVNCVGFYIAYYKQKTVRIAPASIIRDSQDDFLIEVSGFEGKLSAKNARYHEELNSAILRLVVNPQDREARIILDKWRAKVGLNPRSVVTKKDPNLTPEQEKILLESKILYEAGRDLSNTLAYDQAIEPLKRSVDLAIEAGLEGEAVRALIVLANIYANNKDYARCMKYSYQLLSITLNDPDRSRIGGALQSIAFCCYALGYKAITLYCMDQLISIAEVSEDRRAYTYSYKGLVLANEGDIVSAQYYTNAAVNLINKMPEGMIKAIGKPMILAYKAKVTALSGKPLEAVKLYQQTLELGKRAGINHDLMLAQINQGLGESLLMAGKCNAAREKLLVAKSFYAHTKEVKDSLINCTVTNKSCDEQIASIDPECR